jgi:hypothetical protein
LLLQLGPRSNSTWRRFASFQRKTPAERELAKPVPKKAQQENDAEEKAHKASGPPHACAHGC